MYNVTITFNVNGQIISRNEKDMTLLSDSIDLIKARFNFSPEWQGYTKTAIFKSNTKKPYSRILVDDMCMVPPEAIKKSKYMSVSVFGVSGTQLITATDQIVPLTPSGYTDDSIVSPAPTENIYQQIVTIMQRQAVDAVHAETAQGKAEQAERTAKSHAEQTGEDRIATGEDRVATGADRSAVNTALTGFAETTLPAAIESVENKADSEIARVGQAGDEQVLAVETEGAEQIAAVTEQADRMNTELEGTIVDAQTAKSDLDDPLTGAIILAREVEDDLTNPTTGAIKKAEDAEQSIQDAITNNEIVTQTEFIAHKEDYVAEVGEITAQLAGKASVEDVALKADKTYVDAQDALKVNKTVTINGKALSDNISLSAADLANTPTTGIAATNVQAAIEELASFTPATQGLTTVTNKNQYYPIAENNLGAVVGQHQLNVWNGSAWVVSNGYGMGASALASNTGAYSNGFGYSALISNTGGASNGFGYYALSGNTGDYSNGFGHAALTYNTGVHSNGFGYSALISNTGGYSNGFGHAALTGNTGGYSNGFGYSALSGNTGGYSNGFGYSALRYNQSQRNTAVGNEAYSTFLDNVAGAKTADSTAVDIALERVTLTAHGFGANNAIVNVKYTANGTAIGGLATDTIYQVKIIDANTIEFVTGATKRNLTSQGVGTHTFTPQFAYENTSCLGASTVPNKSNQVVLGDTLVDTIKMGGTARTPASSTATGVKGETCWDANYIYVCVATNTWVRSALATW